MGSEHGDQWVRALPWVLLGKRVQVQPDLDASAASLVFGKSIEIPGQLLGHPGPPLSNLQTRALLEELYKISAKPAIQTTSVSNPIDVSITNKATHVYVKVEDPQGLASRFEGPYPVVSRPSRSTVQVRIGSYVNGTPRLQIYNWKSCKIAHMREGAQDGERPRLGRKPAFKDSETPAKIQQSLSKDKERENSNPISGSDTLTPNPHPDYLKKGPLITKDMFDSANWREILSIPTEGTPQQKPDVNSRSNTRPTRSTRNPAPRYVDFLSWPPVLRDKTQAKSLGWGGASYSQN